MGLDRLPEELREVIILYYYQGLKQTEIASILGIGLSLVNFRQIPFIIVFYAVIAAGLLPLIYRNFHRLLLK